MKALAQFILGCFLLGWSIHGIIKTVEAAQAQKQTVSPELQAKILKLQLQASRIQSQYQTCTTTDFQGQMNQVSASVQSVIDAAYREAQLDKKDWDLNLDTFEFTKKTAAAPEPKKDEKKP